MKYRPRKYVAPPEGSLWSDQAAMYIGVALTTLYKWRQNGCGPEPHNVGRKLAYELTVLDAWLHAQGRTNSQPLIASAA